MTVLGVLGRLEVRDWHEHFRQKGVIVFLGANTSLFQAESLGLEEDLLPDDLVDVPHWAFGLGAGLILVTILNS